MKKNYNEKEMTILSLLCMYFKNFKFAVYGF